MAAGAARAAPWLFFCIHAGSVAARPLQPSGLSHCETPERRLTKYSVPSSVHRRSHSAMRDCTDVPPSATTIATGASAAAGLTGRSHCDTPVRALTKYSLPSSVERDSHCAAATAPSALLRRKRARPVRAAESVCPTRPRLRSSSESSVRLAIDYGLKNELIVPPLLVIIQALRFKKNHHQPGIDRVALTL